VLATPVGGGDMKRASLIGQYLNVARMMADTAAGFVFVTGVAETSLDILAATRRAAKSISCLKY